MIGVHRVTKPEGVGEGSCTDQDRLIAELHEGPEPSQHVCGNEYDIERTRFGIQRAGLVVENFWNGDAQSHRSSDSNLHLIAAGVHSTSRQVSSPLWR